MAFEMLRLVAIASFVESLPLVIANTQIYKESHITYEMTAETTHVKDNAIIIANLHHIKNSFI